MLLNSGHGFCMENFGTLKRMVATTVNMTKPTTDRFARTVSQGCVSMKRLESEHAMITKGAMSCRSAAAMMRALQRPLDR